MNIEEPFKTTILQIGMSKRTFREVIFLKWDVK